MRCVDRPFTPTFAKTGILIAVILSLTCSICGYSIGGSVTQDTARLLHKLFNEQGYNREIRPVQNISQPINIELGIALQQLLFVDERSQVMKTNVWIQSSWTDYQLTWDPTEYGGITALRLKGRDVWRPGIVLMNNADGKYEQSYEPNVVIYSYGLIVYIPPAIYKSSCEIDVEFFPFDEQRCELKLASWTYSADEMQYGWYEKRDKAVMQDYVVSGTWDIISCPGRIENASLHGVRPIRMVVFTLTIRRKTLFFTVNLIIPCIMLAFLCSCVFYLPSDAGEKITLSLSLLFAINVFLLLVFKILPATGKQVPLISKYLIFTSAMNITSIMFTVINNNISFRTPLTHRMPSWVRTLFVQRLPRFLFMRSPIHLIDENQQAYLRMRTCECSKLNGHAENTAAMTITNRSARDKHGRPWNDAEHRDLTEDYRRGNKQEARPFSQIQYGLQKPDCSCPIPVKFSDNTMQLIGDIIYMAEYRRLCEEDKQIRCEWKFIAAVVDRILLFVFIIVTSVVTILTFVTAPNIFEAIDQDAILRKMEDTKLL